MVVAMTVTGVGWCSMGYNGAPWQVRSNVQGAWQGGAVQLAWMMVAPPWPR